VGYSRDPQRRLIEHNTKQFNTYTSKHRPWTLQACFECGETEQIAIELERFIKKQKSRKLLEQLCDVSFSPSSINYFMHKSFCFLLQFQYASSYLNEAKPKMMN